MLKRLNILAFIEKWDFLIISTTYQAKRQRQRAKKGMCIKVTLSIREASTLWIIDTTIFFIYSFTQKLLYNEKKSLSIISATIFKLCYL